jgi:hypothetical protein
LAASPPPAAPPAPIMVCASSMNRTIGCGLFLTSSMTFLRRFSLSARPARGQHDGPRGCWGTRRAAALLMIAATAHRQRSRRHPFAERREPCRTLGRTTRLTLRWQGCDVRGANQDPCCAPPHKQPGTVELSALQGRHARKRRMRQAERRSCRQGNAVADEQQQRGDRRHERGEPCQDGCAAHLPALDHLMSIKPGVARAAGI